MRVHEPFTGFKSQDPPFSPQHENILKGSKYSESLCCLLRLQATVAKVADDSAVVELFEGGREPAFLLKGDFAGVAPGLQILRHGAVFNKTHHAVFGCHDMTANNRARS